MTVGVLVAAYLGIGCLFAVADSGMFRYGRVYRPSGMCVVVWAVGWPLVLLVHGLCWLSRWI